MQQRIRVKRQARRVYSLFSLPLDDVMSFAQTLDGTDGLMIVGHLPFLEHLTAFLTTGNPDVTVFKFQNGGIVCLDQLPPPFGWVIKWALMPEIK